MDSRIWRHLSPDLIRRIIEQSNPSIDVQLYFKIKPKKLDERKCWKIWWLLKSHDGLVYNLETKSLHIFRIPRCHIVKRPIEMNWHTAGLTVFNDTEDLHTVEYTCPCGAFWSGPTSNSWTTDLRVLLKRSNPTRELTASDARLR